LLTAQSFWSMGARPDNRPFRARYTPLDDLTSPRPNTQTRTGGGVLYHSRRELSGSRSSLAALTARFDEDRPLLLVAEQDGAIVGGALARPLLGFAWQRAVQTGQRSPRGGGQDRIDI
jgi:hypothetical protein